MASQIKIDRGEERERDKNTKGNRGSKCEQEGELIKKRRREREREKEKERKKLDVTGKETNKQINR